MWWLSVMLAGFAAAELGLRLWWPMHTAGIQKAYEYDRDVGIVLRENLHAFRVTDHQEEVVSNLVGSANFQRDFRGYSHVIFALGDSYTQGTGLAADQAYPFQLDLILNQDSSGDYRKRYGVVNLGLAAYGAEQSRLVFERFAARLGDPAACLYLGSDNDFDDDLLFKSGARHRHVVFGSPRFGRLVPFLIWAGNLQLVLRVKTVLASRRLVNLRTRARSAETPGRVTSGVDMTQLPDSSRTTEPLSSPSGQRVAGLLKSVAELEWPVIEQIVAACRSRGAVTILSWSATPAQSASYAWLHAQSRTKGIGFNDWYSRAETVRAAIPTLQLENPHSGGHYRGWIAREIAEGFARELRATGAPLPVPASVPE